MELEIRTGVATDREAVVGIDSYHAAGSRERAEDIDRWLRAGEAYVAIERETVCAYAVLGELFGRPFIRMLMVAEEHRGQGIGNRFVAFLEGRVEGPELWTSTNLSNQRMQRLLASRGFQLTGFIDNLDPDDPELIFFKRLEG